MKKLFLVVFTILMLFVSKTGFCAIYDIIDTTKVPRSDGGGLVDVIGNPAYFDIYGIDYSQSGPDLNFSIYTNFPENGVAVCTWHTLPAHFAISKNNDGNYDYGLVLSAFDPDGRTKGDLYNVSDWWYASHYKPSGGYVYGVSEVTIKDGYVIESGNIVTWNPSDKDGLFRIDFTLNAASILPDPGEYDIGIRWSPNCANDLIKGEVHVSNPVPEPTTMILLGSGLFGLASIGMRKKRA